MTFPPELLDELLKGYQNPEDLLGQGGILKQLTAALVERCLNAELKTQLEEQRTQPESGSSPRNRRNGHSQKTIKGEFGQAEIAIPHDRNGEFEPIIVKKGQTRFDGFDDKILSLYSRGMSTRDIQAQLQDLYGVEVSAGLISNVTEAVEAERKLWQHRSLDAVYPIVYFDALMVKVRQDGQGINKRPALKEGFPAAIEAVFPQTLVQLCIVHLVRNSLSDVSYKDRKAGAADLRWVYTAATEAEAEQALVDFAEVWDAKYPTISKSWMTHWNRVIPFFSFPPEIRRAIYTTNAIESFAQRCGALLNMTLRKVLKPDRAFPTDESALKVIYLAIQNISKKWTMPIRDWKPALNRFAIEFGDRFPL